MKRVCVFVIITLFSCKSYVDNNEVNKLHNDYFKMSFNSDYNILTYLSMVGRKADNEVNYPQHYEILVPKKMKVWHISNNSFYAEYDSKQIIYINAGYKNEMRKNDWTVIDYKDINASDILFTCWKDRGYNLEYLDKPHEGRITKQYSDGKTKILLYNIEAKNFEKYFNLLKNFKYIE